MLKKKKKKKESCSVCNLPHTASLGPAADTPGLSADPPHHCHLLSTEAQSFARRHQSNCWGCLYPQPIKWVKSLVCQTHVLSPGGRLGPQVCPCAPPDDTHGLAQLWDAIMELYSEQMQADRACIHSQLYLRIRKFLS